MAKVVVKFSGDTVISNLRTVIEAKSLEVAESVASNARALAPAETGALRRSIKAKKSKFKNGGAVVIAGGGDEYYATFKELGTSKMAATPFLRPAIEMSRAKAKRLIMSALKNGAK